MVARVVAYMLAASVAVLTAGEIFQGGIITYTSVPAVLMFGLVLGLLNAFVKPVLEMVAAPLSCLTFGLISGALSFLIFGAAAVIVPGIDANIWGVLVGTVLTTAISGVIYAILDER
jgi:putative membrane protein